MAFKKHFIINLSTKLKLPALFYFHEACLQKPRSKYCMNAEWSCLFLRANLELDPPGGNIWGDGGKPEKQEEMWHGWTVTRGKDQSGSMLLCDIHTSITSEPFLWKLIKMFYCFLQSSTVNLLLLSPWAKALTFNFWNCIRSQLRLLQNAVNDVNKYLLSDF